MIEGRVSDTFEAVVRLVIRGPSGRTREIDAAIDTGFSGFLTLTPAFAADLGLDLVSKGTAFLADGTEASFDVYNVVLEWDGQERLIEVFATGDTPLVGMGLLYRHNLLVEVVEGGRVVVEERG